MRIEDLLLFLGGGSTSGPLLLNGQLSADARLLRNGDGSLARALYVTGFILPSLCVRDKGAAHAYVDWLSERGFNGARLFCGPLVHINGQTREEVYKGLPIALGLLADKGRGASLSLLTDTRDSGGYDKRLHVQEVLARAKDYERIDIEGANEYYHSSQDSEVNDIHYMVRLMQELVASTGLPWAIGAAAIDELTKPASEGGFYPAHQGSAISVHLARDRHWFVQMARIRESEEVSRHHNKYVWSREPIGWDEPGTPRVIDGSRLNNPSAFFQLGAFCRIMELGCVGHGQHALRCEMPGPRQDLCAQAMVQGWMAVEQAIERTDVLTLKNGHWLDAPAYGRFFQDGEPLDTPNRVWRVSSGVTANRAAVVVAGINDDPGVGYRDAWFPERLIAEMPQVQVWRAVKAE